MLLTCASEYLVSLSALFSHPQGFPDAQRFDPDRMSPERKEDILHANNFLTFGHGPHYCVGECAGWGGQAKPQALLLTMEGAVGGLML